MNRRVAAAVIATLALVGTIVIVAVSGGAARAATITVTRNGVDYTTLTNPGNCAVAPVSTEPTTLLANCDPPATKSVKVNYVFGDDVGGRAAAATVSADFVQVAGTPCFVTWVKATRTLRVSVPFKSVCRIRSVTWSQSTSSPTGPPTTSPPPTSPPPSSPPPSSPPPTGSVEVAAAGDIATSGGGDTLTSNEVITLNPDAVLALGDLAYPGGTAAQFTNYYDPTWGRFKAITYAAPGNHEYNTTNAAGYFGYFGTAAHGPDGYYTFMLGDWQVYSMNSEIAHAASSPQIAWLNQQLQQNPQSCILAYWHKPRYSSGTEHGDNTSMQPFIDALQAANADIVLNGHEHGYERFAPLNGLREFVVGTGGATLRDFGTAEQTSEVRLSTWGVIDLILSPDGYTWEFRDTNDATLDSGSGGC